VSVSICLAVSPRLRFRRHSSVRQWLYALTTCLVAKSDTLARASITWSPTPPTNERWDDAKTRKCIIYSAPRLGGAPAAARTRRK